MTKLSEDVKKAIGDIRPAFIATASKDGKPNVSAKGSFQVLDDEHVAFAEVASPRTLANIKENPQVAAIVLDPATRKGCRIWGKAEIVDSGEQFDAVSARLGKMGAKVNHLVKIAVEEAIAF